MLHGYTPAARFLPYLSWAQIAELPDKAETQLAPLTTPIGELFRYQLTGAGHDLTELRSLQDWVVERQMRLAPGAADVPPAHVLLHVLRQVDGRAHRELMPRARPLLVGR